MEGFEKIKGFTIKSLSYLPRVGELVQVPYFNEIMGTDYYHVKDIRHRLEDDKQIIIIFLLYGSYSPYLNLRRDQAIETRELSWRNCRTKNDYELKELLYLRPNNAW